MKRREVFVAMPVAALGLIALAAPGANSIAQRPAQPIQRPRPGRPDRPLSPGRLPGATGGVAGSAVQAGVFKVEEVSTRENTVMLGDDAGRTAEVFVDTQIFDLSELSRGDEVIVDFFLGGSGDRLEAAGIWKLDPKRP